MVDRTGLHTAPVPGNPPLGTAPVDGRLVQAALFGSTGQCLNGGGLTPSSTTMAFTVAAGVYQIPDTANGGAVYHSPVDSASVTPAAGQAGGRIDSLYVLQQDYEKNGTTSRVVYGLAAGTPGSGTAPSLSGIAGGPMRLANITVPASATKATDCTVAWVVPPAILAVNGPVVASKLLLDLITGAYVGERAYVGSYEYRWSGTQWVLEARPTMRYGGRFVSTPATTISANQWTGCPIDTTTSDPSGLMAPQNGYNVRTPWKGRYRVFFRFAFTGGDIPPSSLVGLRLCTSGNDVFAFQNAWGAPNDGPLSVTSEVNIDPSVAGQDSVFAQVYFAGTGSRTISNSDDAHRPEMDVQYLGAA